jgi:hypothetical protein
MCRHNLVTRTPSKGRIITLAATIALAACSASQPQATAPAAIPFVHGITASEAMNRGIYVSESSGAAPQVFGYPPTNRGDKRPICSEDVSDENADVSVDAEGNLMLSTFTGEVLVYQGPDMCGPLIGTIDIEGVDMDAASADAANGEIVIVNANGYDSVSSLAICTIAGGCATFLTSADIDELNGVALSPNGDCWASGLDKHLNGTLFYFKGCAGSGVRASNFKDQSPFGLDIDNQGNIVSIDSSRGFYVYSGCTPNCKLLGGPFAFEGSSNYGHLNENSTELAVADFQYGQVDVYAYSPTKITYQYSFSKGLAQADDVIGAAFNPRSKE